MPKIHVTLKGHVSYFASRTFEMELGEDKDLGIMSIHVLEDIADKLQIPWEFGNEGHVQATEFVVEQMEEK